MLIEIFLEDEKQKYEVKEVSVSILRDQKKSLILYIFTCLIDGLNPIINYEK